MRRLSLHWLVTVSALSLLAGGCRSTDSGPGAALAGLFGGRHVTVPSGTVLSVRLDRTLSSETASRGDTWQGVVTRPVILNGHEVIPGGATVSGVVVDAEAAQRGNRAKLELGVRAVRIGDHKTALDATADPVIARSPRTRNLGAIAGGALAGALIGGATSDHPGTGALIGGGAATGAVALSKGYQVVLRDGAVLEFVVSESVAVRVG